MQPAVLTIAGSDPSGGAGIQADLKTFHHFGAYGMAAVTLLTVQNTVAISSVRVLDPDFVMAQIAAVLEDIPPRAAKTGALGSPEIVDALTMMAPKFEFPLVVDPVFSSGGGKTFLDEDAIRLFRRALISRAYLVTPNVPEAEILAEREIHDVRGMEQAAVSIGKLGAKHVLVKGGHLPGEASTDVLYTDGSLHRFTAARIPSQQGHGTGCVLSAAITAMLAHGMALGPAVQRAKSYLTRALETAPQLGRGKGPLNLFAVPENSPRGG